MAAISAEGLMCQICFDYLDEPKQLYCGHTFCKKCLDKLESVRQQVNGIVSISPHFFAVLKYLQGAEYDFTRSFQTHLRNVKDGLTCPVCSVIFLGKLSDLPTNTTLEGKVEQFKRTILKCTKCDNESPAISFCEVCRISLCEACKKLHEVRYRNTTHELIDIDKIREGAVVIKHMCKNHQHKPVKYICTRCKNGFCENCRGLDCDSWNRKTTDLYTQSSRLNPDNNKTHECIDASMYEWNVRDRTEQLQKGAKHSIDCMSSYRETQKEKVARTVSYMKREIADAHEEAIKELEQSKNHLLRACDKRESELVLQLDKREVKENVAKLVSTMKTSCELVGHGTKAMDSRQMLHAHVSLCHYLISLIMTSSSKATEMIKGGDPLHLRTNHVEIGEIVDWKLKTVVNLYKKDGMYDLVPRNEMIAVGSYKSGIEIYSVDGKLREQGIDNFLGGHNSRFGVPLIRSLCHT